MLYMEQNFNTSHVNVNPMSGAVKGKGVINFNTSHVNVNQSSFQLSPKLKIFQYISC